MRKYTPCPLTLSLFDSPINSKICTKCKEAKDTSCFTLRNASADKLSLTCRDCAHKSARERYLRNPEKFKQKALEWAREHRGEKRAISNRWQKANPEKRRQKQYRYMQNRSDEQRQRDLEAGRKYQALRRDRKEANGGEISLDWWRSHIDLFEEGTCLYCKTYGHRLVMDHFYPIVLGGRTEVGNLLPCCKSCNSRKNGKDPADWVVKTCGQDMYDAIVAFLKLIREAYEEEQLS